MYAKEAVVQINRHLVERAKVRENFFLTSLGKPGDSFLIIQEHFPLPGITFKKKTNTTPRIFSIKQTSKAGKSGTNRGPHYVKLDVTGKVENCLAFCAN